MCSGALPPAGAVHVEALARVGGAGVPARGEGGAQLEERLLGGAAQADIVEGRGRRRGEERLGFEVGETGEVGAVLVKEGPPAPAAALGVDGDAGGAERVHVPEDRALGDLQPSREVAGGEPAVGLQQQQD